ncbi:hypothetical protein MP638_002599 [Amoeboaphelidium occidentale]|nr:hypothetical protein MP638_002599 [Amoeboaphelidium occidentale]
MRICDLLASSSDELKNIGGKSVKIVNQPHDQDLFRLPSVRGYHNGTVTSSMISSDPVSEPVVVIACHSFSYLNRVSPNNTRDDERYKARKWMPIPIPPVQTRKKRNLLAFETRSKGIKGSKDVQRRVRAKSQSSPDSQSLQTSRARGVRMSSRSF